jgi:FkbM family methyltransferase
VPRELDLWFFGQTDFAGSYQKIRALDIVKWRLYVAGKQQNQGRRWCPPVRLTGLWPDDMIRPGMLSLPLADPVAALRRRLVASPLALRSLQVMFSAVRAKALPTVAWLFDGLVEPCVHTRKLFGYPISFDLSRSNTQRLLYLEGERFIEERHVIRSLIANGMRMVDVGANIGYYLLMLERFSNESGFITAIEPGAANLVEFKRTLALNKFSNVELVEAAAGSSDGHVALNEGLNATVASNGTGDVRVPLVRVDGAVSGRVDFMKIDVEGYEGEVLLGARETIERYHPRLFVEIHPQLLSPGHSVRSIIDMLVPHYDDMEVYAHVARTRAQRLKDRYLGSGGIGSWPCPRTDAELAPLLHDVFWLVCR